MNTNCSYLSENIESASESIIYSFVKSYSGRIVITNQNYKTIANEACLSCKCSELDLSQSNIEHIRDDAFCGCTNLVKLLLPDTLISIGPNSFALTSISSVHFGPNLKGMSGYSFNQCPNLNNFSIDPNNTFFTVVNNFVLSKDLTTIVRTPIDFEMDDIPNKENITSLSYSFCSGASIHRFIGWKTLTNLSSVGFHSNNFLEYVDLSMTQISVLEYVAFHWLPNLKTIILPPCLTELKESSINQVIQLRVLSLPASVNIIADSCFSESRNLRIICYYGSVSFAGRNLLYNCPSMKYVRVAPWYPSDKFSSFSVSFDVYKLGETLTSCPTIKNIPVSFQFQFLYCFILL